MIKHLEIQTYLVMKKNIVLKRFLILAMSVLIKIISVQLYLFDLIGKRIKC